MFDFIKEYREMLKTKDERTREVELLNKRVTNLKRQASELENSIEYLFTHKQSEKQRLDEINKKFHTTSENLVEKESEIQILSTEINSLVYFINEIRESELVMVNNIRNLQGIINGYDLTIEDKKTLLRNLTGTSTYITGTRNTFYKFKYPNIENIEVELVNLCRIFVSNYDCRALLYPRAIDNILYYMEYSQNDINNKMSEGDKAQTLLALDLYKKDITTFFSLLKNKGLLETNNEEKILELLKYSVLEKTYTSLEKQFVRMKDLDVQKNTLKEVSFSFFESLHEKEITQFKYLAFISYFLELKNYVLQYSNLEELYKFYLNDYYEEYKIFTLGEKLDKPIDKTTVTINDIDTMAGIEFEGFLVLLFKNLNYKTILTKASGDQGADLIIEKNNIQYAVQAKRYTGTVGNKAVQEVISGKNYYNTDEAMVVTTSEFTKSAKELADVSNVILVDKYKLKDMISLAF